MSDTSLGGLTDDVGMPSATSSGASLKVALVGPTHPYKGGVAAHTTTLAHELAEAGHEVTLVSWSHLYPSALYPGEQAVPGGSPDVEPFPRTLRALLGPPRHWVRTGRRLRDVDVIVVVHVIPAVVPAHRGPARRGRRPHVDDRSRAALGRHRAQRPPARGPPRRPAAHGGVPVPRRRRRRPLRRAGEPRGILGATHVKELDLPPHLPGDPHRAPSAPGDTDVRLLSLGIVRDYKGVDLLATPRTPGTRLTVAGERGMPAAASASWPPTRASRAASRCTAATSPPTGSPASWRSTTSSP